MFKTYDIFEMETVNENNSIPKQITFDIHFRNKERRSVIYNNVNEDYNGICVVGNEIFRNNKMIYDNGIYIGDDYALTDLPPVFMITMFPKRHFKNHNIYMTYNSGDDYFYTKTIPVKWRNLTEDDLTKLKEEWYVERKRLANITYTKDGFTPEIGGHFNQEIFEEYVQSLHTELAQSTVIAYLNDNIKGSGIMVAAAGSIPGDVHKLWDSYDYNTYHMEYGYSCMGYEINGALGVKIAEPNKEVYAMAGDGSFNMLHSELLTSIQYGYKINVVILDNSGFGCINNLQMSNGSDSFYCEFRDKDNNILDVDYEIVAKGYGAQTYKVTNLEELKYALEESRKSTKSTVIVVKVLPKTMTAGYGSWWTIGVSSVSSKEKVIDAYNDKENILKNAKKY